MPVHGVDHHQHLSHRPDPLAADSSSQADHLPSFRQRSATSSLTSPQLLPQTTYHSPRAHQQPYHQHHQQKQQQQQRRLSLSTGFNVSRDRHSLNQSRSVNTPSPAPDGSSPDPRSYYLQYRDPFGYDGSGPYLDDAGDGDHHLANEDDKGLTTPYAWRSGSPTSQHRRRPSPRPTSPTSSHGQTKELPPSSPEYSRHRHQPAGRQVSLKHLVEKFDQNQDHAPPRPSLPNSRSPPRHKSPGPYAPTTSGSRPQATRVSIPDRSSAVAPSRTLNNSTADDSTIPANSHVARKPLFGEIIPSENYPQHSHYTSADEGRGRSAAARGRSGSDGSIPSPNPMFIDDPVNPPSALSPTSPSAWYLGYTPSLDKVNTSPSSSLAHRRSRSDMGGKLLPRSAATGTTSKMRITTTTTTIPGTAESQSPATPSSTTTPRPQSRSSSRIPISSRRQSHTSDSGSSSPSIKAGNSSPLERNAAGVHLPPKGASALPKPSTQKPQQSPTSPKATTKSPLKKIDVSTPPRQRGNGNGQHQSQKSPTLNAYIGAPPPKTSPPLRSSRPRQPVSSATTSASRAKVVDRISSFNGGSNTNTNTNATTSPSSTLPKHDNSRSNRQNARRIPELGGVDFAARRHQIQRAFNKSIRESNAKKEERAERRRQLAKEKEKEQDTHAQRQQQPHQKHEQEAKENQYQMEEVQTPTDDQQSLETPVAPTGPMLEADDQPPNDPKSNIQATSSSPPAAADSPEAGEDEFVTPKEGRSPRVSDSLSHDSDKQQDAIGEVVAPAASEGTRPPTADASAPTTVEEASSEQPSHPTETETSPVSAVTTTTIVDTKPQSEVSQPAEEVQTLTHSTMLSHIMQMRESSASESSSSEEEDDDDDDDDDLSERGEKESIQIMLRRSGFYAESMGTSSENHDEGDGDDADDARCSEERNRWSLGSWTSSAAAENQGRRPSEGSSVDVGRDGTINNKPQQQRDVPPVDVDHDSVPTPEPLFASRYDPRTTKDSDADVPSSTSTQQPTTVNGVRVSNQFLQQYPDLVRQARWDSKRATQLYLQQIAHNKGSDSSRLPVSNAGIAEAKPDDGENVSTTADDDDDGDDVGHGQSNDKNEQQRGQATDALTDEAVVVPETDDVPDSDYACHRPSLNLRDDWERASPSIADWMHLVANDNNDDDDDEAEPSSYNVHTTANTADAVNGVGREGAETPRISASQSGPTDDGDTYLAVDGLGLSIHVQSPEDDSGGDSPTIPLHSRQHQHDLPPPPPPPKPDYAPPPPPPVTARDDRSKERLSDGPSPPQVQVSPSIYSSHPPSTTLPSVSYVPPQPAPPSRHEYGASGNRSSESSSLHHVGITPSLRTRTSSATSQERISGDQPTTAVEPTASKPQQPSSSSTATDTRRLSKRSNVIKELVDTEYTFGQDMTVVVDIYKGTSSSCLDLSAEDVKTLFGNAEQIVKFSMDFQDTLKKAAKSVYVLPKSQRWRSKRGSKHMRASNLSAADRQSKQQKTQSEERGENEEEPDVFGEQRDRETCVGRTFMEHIERMEKVYSDYLKNHDAANKKLEVLQKSKKVNIWLRECREWAADLTTAWNLDSLLVKPVQRILKYPLLLTELLSATPTDHPDHSALADALRETTSISGRINEMKKRADVVGQVVSNRKRKESDVRTGLSKAFGRRTEKLKQHVGLTETFTDKDFDGLAQQFGDNFFQLQLIMRDVELYMTEVQNSVNKFHDFAVAIEAYVTLAPSNYPEMESKWCRFRLAAKDVQNVALADHLASVRKSVINPMVTLLKLHEGPQRVMQKRNKRLLDYVKLKAVQDRGDKADKKTKEQGEQFVALNDTLKDELPKLVTLTGRLMEGCLTSFVKLQTAWNSVVQKRLGYILDRAPEDIAEHIISDWSGDFSFSEAQVLSLGICNGSLLADTAIAPNLASPTTSTDPKVSTSSSRPSTMNSGAPRNLSNAAESFGSPKASSHDVGARSPNTFVQSPMSMNSPDMDQHQYQHQHQHRQSNDRARGSTESRARANSSLTGRISSTSEIPSLVSVMNHPSSRTSTSTSTNANANHNQHQHQHQHQNQNPNSSSASRPPLNTFRSSSETSPSLPQLSLESPQLHEFLADPTLLANHRGAPPDPTDHPSSPTRFSGLFSSAMPMQDPSMPPTSADARPAHPRARAESHSTGDHSFLHDADADDDCEVDESEPVVLFLAASMFEFNIDRARREAGYPYLTYVAGEIFDVLGEKGDLWLARNQDDPHRQIGWIWTKHFAKIGGT